MKNRFILLLILALFSIVSGVLISKMSFIGKVGITFLYDEYTILKSWWQTALMLFVVQMGIFGLMYYFHFKQTAVLMRKILPLILIVVGIIGLYLTFIDFTETSHRLMSTSFHMGFYLFWITWFINCIYFLVLQKKERKLEAFHEIYQHESQE
ncbi:MAG TPA: hypothetical protein VIG94_07990 [Faecalibacter sp.]